MTVATYEQLRAAAGPITEGRIKLAKSLAQKDLFLSHSSGDSAQLGPAIALLEKHGGNVYADVMDAGIKTLSPVEVAGRLRRAVSAYGRLVVLVSEKTATSRWVPWEMGLADGSAGSSQVALLPVRSSATASELWAQQEYFNLYWRIEFVELEGESAPCWAAWNPANAKYRRLRKWIEDTAPHIRK